MIEVNHLTKFYGSVTAVEDLTFSVEKGRITGFLGPNGAGKTTTMRILTGFTPPSRGVAKIAGFDVTESPIEVKRRIGYVPENVPLYLEMTVLGFLKYVADIKGIPRRGVEKEAARVMERCGLVEMTQRTIRNLSKGYRQRVGLAQALIGNPPVLVLDEPTVGLDPKQIIEIRQMIKDLAVEHTVLLSTHILAEVSMICQDVIIINHGRIVAQDSMAHLATGGETETIDIEVKGEPEVVLQILKGISGVESAQSERTPRSYSAVGQRGSGFRARISIALAEKGLGLVSMHERSRTLEDVFVEAISADHAEQVVS
jgi:ABC-2 type transport system ATP-binding protein